jgi:hypothetical protein
MVNNTVDMEQCHEKGSCKLNLVYLPHANSENVLCHR